MRFLLGMLLLASLPVHAQVQIEKPWMRATPPGAKIAAGYMTLRNSSASPERLVGASSPAGARVEMHVTIKDGEILRMREVKALEVPAKGVLELKPAGTHLMVVDIKQPLKAGDRIPVTLRFEHSKEIAVEFEVSPLTGAPPNHHPH